MISTRFKVTRLLYTGMMYMLLPAIFIRLAWKGQQQIGYRQRWKERLGFTPITTKPSIWIHCVSVGETLGANSLIQALIDQHPNNTIYITTTTPTGSEQVKRCFINRVIHSYLPYDIPNLLNRFIKRAKPTAAIILETEAWPNAFWCCYKKQIPLLLANARLSQRSCRRYQRLGHLAKDLFNLPAVIAAQSKCDATHFKQLGVNPKKLHITGNLKFDKSISPMLSTQAQTFKQMHQLEKRPIFIAGSTREQEETTIIEAFKAIQQAEPNTLLILAPRHPTRLKEIQTLCTTQNLSYQCKSALTPDQIIDSDILLINTIGELLLFYAVADICFVGGSLVNKGCHNIIEPAALAKPILVGPSVFNFKQAYEWLNNANAIYTVLDANELAVACIELIKKPAAQKAMGQRALAVYQANQGATQKHLALIDPLIKRVA
jgi:3-deoxy-D-manno-octulosonic-acid transferase